MINEFSGRYRFLSNFWSCFIKYEGDVYPSVENAYQAAKMRNVEDRQRFFYNKASEAKKLGRLLPMRAEWDQVRLDVMYELVKKKFSQDPLKSYLLNTGDEEIQEGNWWGDTFWGTVNGEGENHLGKILMRIREELRTMNEVTEWVENRKGK
jgi:ribA/ribD-fused uncharacterized protein